MVHQLGTRRQRQRRRPGLRAVNLAARDAPRLGPNGNARARVLIIFRFGFAISQSDAEIRRYPLQEIFVSGGPGLVAIHMNL
jgi:hypothetical protein